MSPFRPRSPLSSRRVGWGVALSAAWIGLGFVARGPEALAADPTPDFAFFKEKIEPVLQSVCSECHAGKGRGQFALIVHAPGAPFPEAEHRKNYDTVVKLLVAGKPEQSKFLLKPLAVRDGGVAHEGGDRIFRGTPAYRAWTDFINGVKGAGGGMPAGASATTTATPGQPDLGFFVARIEPTLQSVCSQCHAGRGRGQFALVTHLAGAPFPLADHRKNYDTVLRLLVPGKPEQSRFLLKPLAVADGGIAHEGGDRIAKGDANHRNWTDFINGVKGPPPPEDAPPEPEAPVVAAKGLVLEGESLALSGDLRVEDGPGGAKVVRPGPAGGRLTGTFRVTRTGEFALALRLLAGTRGVRVRVDGGEPLDVEGPKEGLAEVSPRLPLDGNKPLDGRVGRVRIEGEAVLLDGRETAARFLGTGDVPHSRVEAVFSMPEPDEPGRDDAWLLFDCIDPDNGKFFGLADGGRRVVMGVLEGGRPRVIRSAPRPEGAEPKRLGVDLVDGIAFGRVDGTAVLSVNFDRGLGAQRFGFMTHGAATVTALAALRGGEEVYRLRPAEGGVLHLARGEHAIEVELPPSGAGLDSLTVKDTIP